MCGKSDGKIFQDKIQACKHTTCQFQWPRRLRHRSAAASLLRSWVRIPPGAWMSVCCECCVLSGRGICDELITRPEESYRLRCVDVRDLEKITFVNEDEGQDPLRDYRAKRKKKYYLMLTPLSISNLKYNYNSEVKITLL